MRHGPGVRCARPWQGERPGASAMRQNASDELLTLIAFDIACDKARHTAGELCKDYGLTRTQASVSVFEGPMTRTRREERSACLVKVLEAAEGGSRLAVYPIGERESVWAARFATNGAPPKDARAAGPAVASARPAPQPAADPLKPKAGGNHG